MSVMALQIFVSLLLVAFSVVMFWVSIRLKDPEHADRLSLAPLEKETLCKPDASNTTTR